MLAATSAAVPGIQKKQQKYSIHPLFITNPTLLNLLRKVYGVVDPMKDTQPRSDYRSGPFQ